MRVSQTMGIFRNPNFLNRSMFNIKRTIKSNVAFSSTFITRDMCLLLPRWSIGMHMIDMLFDISLNALLLFLYI